MQEIGKSLSIDRTAYHQTQRHSCGTTFDQRPSCPRCRVYRPQYSVTDAVFTSGVVEVIDSTFRNKLVVCVLYTARYKYGLYVLVFRNTGSGKNINDAIKQQLDTIQ